MDSAFKKNDLLQGMFGFTEKIIKSGAGREKHKQECEIAEATITLYEKIMVGLVTENQQNKRMA